MNTRIRFIYFKKLTFHATFFVILCISQTGLTSNVISLSRTKNTISSDDRISALYDPSGRISADFKIPEKLKKRTSFWFDIYTLYGDRDHVIHHSLYPWIIYKVVNTQDIYNSNLHKWTKYHKERRTVNSDVRAVLAALKRLKVRKNYRNLKGLDKSVYLALQSVPGKRRAVITEALGNIRVQLGQKDFFVKGLKNSTRYFSHIEAEFKANDLPTELARLPFVESSFNIHAESRVGASGIWQIMPKTGKHYLLVTDTIDERNSPLKASVAAAQILKANYKSLKNWPLAITAYNHGAYGIKRAMRKAKVNNLPDLIENYHEGSFKFASANFYASFVAVLHAQKYKFELFKLSDLDFASEIKPHAILLDKPMKFKSLLSALGIEKEIILEYNLDLKHASKNNAKIPRGYIVILPAEAQNTIQKIISSGQKGFRSASLSNAIKASS